MHYLSALQNYARGATATACRGLLAPLWTTAIPCYVDRTSEKAVSSAKPNQHLEPAVAVQGEFPIKGLRSVLLDVSVDTLLLLVHKARRFIEQENHLDNEGMLQRDKGSLGKL